MQLNEYQALARTTAIYNNKIYPILGLAGEAGEVCEKFKKNIRDNNGVVTEEFILAVKKELGDTLWYISNIATDLDISLEDIAQTNINKLQSRKERGVIQGSGDNR